MTDDRRPSAMAAWATDAQHADDGIPLDDGSIHSAVCTLLETPRQLGAALREAEGSWVRLRGEADPYDVLLLSVLKSRVPSVWALLGPWSVILSGFSWRAAAMSQVANETARARDEEARTSRSKFVENVATAADADRAPEYAVLVLIAAVFRDAPEILELPTPHGLSPPGKQSIAGGGGVDYLGRILRGGLTPDEISDVDVVGQLDGWANGKVSADEIAESVVRNSRRAERIAHWSVVAPTSDYLDVATLLLQRAAAAPDSDRSRLLRAAARIARCSRQLDGRVEWSEWVLGSFDELTFVNFPFAIEAVRTLIARDVHGDSAAARLDEIVRERMRSRYASDRAVENLRRDIEMAHSPFAVAAIIWLCAASNGQQTREALLQVARESPRGLATLLWVVGGVPRDVAHTMIDGQPRIVHRHEWQEKAANNLGLTQRDTATLVANRIDEVPDGPLRVFALGLIEEFGDE